MIIYDLVCEAGHAFEGWFKSVEDYTHQQAGGRLCCPVCDTTSVSRTPSASYVQRSRTSPNRTRTGAPQASREPTIGGDLSPGQVQAFVTQLKDYVQNQTEDVGRAFAEESRKMHYGEIEHRQIRGEVSVDEFEALNEEGVDLLPFPEHWVNKKRLN